MPPTEPHRRAELQLYARAINNEWPMPTETKERIIAEMLGIVSGEIPASSREKIRAAECLAKLDALNIAREGQEKTKRLDISVVPPAYEQLSGQANSEMIDYLQRAALADETESAQ